MCVPLIHVSIDSIIIIEVDIFKYYNSIAKTSIILSVFLVSEAVVVVVFVFDPIINSDSGINIDQNIKDTSSDHNSNTSNLYFNSSKFNSIYICACTYNIIPKK